jgi:hypothetical protein
VLDTTNDSALLEANLTPRDSRYLVIPHSRERRRPRWEHCIAMLVHAADSLLSAQADKTMEACRTASSGPTIATVHALGNAYLTSSGATTAILRAEGCVSAVSATVPPFGDGLRLDYCAKTVRRVRLSIARERSAPRRNGCIGRHNRAIVAPRTAERR